MTTYFTAAPGVDVITTTADIPALGSIAINAFVLHGTEPVLVDTGTVAGATEFMTALESVIDPTELRWVWLTHTDFDHIGSLAALLDANRGFGSSRRSSASASWGCQRRRCQWTACTSSTPASRSTSATAASRP